jgi:molybdopterin-binding protein
MRLSARNQIKGTVTNVITGATTAHVRVDIGGGNIVTSSITNDAVDELGIKKGSKVIVGEGVRRDDRRGLTARPGAQLRP